MNTCRVSRYGHVCMSQKLRAGSETDIVSITVSPRETDRDRRSKLREGEGGSGGVERQKAPQANL